MDKNKGIVVGTIGATVGSIGWLVIAGIAIKSWIFSLLPIILGLVCIISVIKLNNLHPERKFAIIGLTVLWLVILNFIFGNIVYERIPDTVWGIPTGKDMFNHLKLNVFLGLFSLWGFYSVAKDLLRKE